MSRKDVSAYDACDKAIKAMDRENVEAFGRLKMSDLDNINVIKTVVKVYRDSAKRARKRYYKVAYDAYMYGLYMCGITGDEARRMADKVITDKWVDRVLSETDFITMYRFDTETERKAYRLAEVLEVSLDRNREIDRALKAWSQQLAQYAINFTDYAIVQAYQDAGVETLEWETERDERVCHACNALDGKKFPIDEVPRKPHWGCRCLILPV